MESRRWWAWATRGWLLTGAIVLSYANLVYTGTRLMGDLPVYAVVVPFVSACALTGYASSLEGDPQTREASDDPLYLTCFAVVAIACDLVLVNGAMRVADRSALQLLAIPALLFGGCALLLLGLLAVTLPFASLWSLLVGPLRRRAIAALAIQTAVVACGMLGPGMFVSEQRDRDAALDCTSECRTVAFALEKRGKPTPTSLDEAVFKELVAEKLLKRLPVHRIGGEKVTPRYYVMRGHVLCMRHFRGRY